MCLLLVVPATAQVFSFSSPVDVPSRVMGALGDLTGDGRADAVCLGGGTVEVHIANQNGTFAPPVCEPMIAETANIFDFNGDGARDTVFVHRPQVGCTGEIRAGLNLGACVGAGPGIAFSSFAAPIALTGCFAGPERVLFDGQRLWVWEPLATRVWWYDVTPSAMPGGAPTITPTGFWFPACGVIQEMVLCNLDGDADIDVVIACTTSVASTQATVHTFLGSPSGPIANPGAPPIVLLGIPSMEVADVNGDHLDDVVAAVAGGVGMLRNLGPTGGGVGLGFFSLWSADAEAVAAGDFDGDGDQDIAIARLSSQVSFLSNDGSGVFTLETVHLPTFSGATLFVGDLNADGCDEVVTTGAAGGVRSWLSTTIPLVEPRPGTLDGVQLETTTGVGGLPPSGPLGAVKHAFPGTFLTASVVATPAFGGSPIVFGVELFPTGCPPLPSNSQIWVSSTTATVTVWDILPANGIYDLVVGVPPSLPFRTSGLIQAGVLSPLTLNGAAAATPAHEIQF